MSRADTHVPTALFHFSLNADDNQSMNLFLFLPHSFTFDFFFECTDGFQLFFFHDMSHRLHLPAHTTTTNTTCCHVSVEGRLPAQAALPSCAIMRYINLHLHYDMQLRNKMNIKKRARQQFTIPEYNTVCFELVGSTLDISTTALACRRCSHNAQLCRQF